MDPAAASMLLQLAGGVADGVLVYLAHPVRVPSMTLTPLSVVSHSGTGSLLMTTYIPARLYFETICGPFTLIAHENDRLPVTIELTYSVPSVQRLTLAP